MAETFGLDNHAPSLVAADVCDPALDRVARHRASNRRAPALHRSRRRVVLLSARDGVAATTSEWVGKRCRMRYGLGTIATDWSDKGLFGVTDDVGYWWLCDENEVCCAECDIPLYLGHEPECSGGQNV